MNSKLLYILSLIILLLISIHGNAFADGGAFKYVDNSILERFKEDSQLCFINYQNETQKMIINITLNDKFEEEKAIWLFPIPAKPNETKIDIIDSEPILSGVSSEHILANRFNDCFTQLYLTQIYTYPYFMFQLVSNMTGDDQGRSKESDKFRVIDKINKFGITSELISVKNKKDFIEYLTKHKIKFPDDFNKIIDGYLGKDYIFVVSWLSNLAEYKNKTNGRYPIAVYVTFKTPEIFFPLKFTSIYGNLKIPISLYVINFITPKIFDNIRQYTKIEHFRIPYSTPNDLLNFFFDIKKFDRLEYTKISINSEAINLTEDLWIDHKESFRISMIKFF